VAGIVTQNKHKVSTTQEQPRPAPLLAANLVYAQHSHRREIMDTSNHDKLSSLFAQLGLPNTENDIQTFTRHHRLAPSEHIEKANFWNNSQRTFLKEALQWDSDWVELVDHLDALLHR
jgi:hypothetical protein